MKPWYLVAGAAALGVLGLAVSSGRHQAALRAFDAANDSRDAELVEQTIVALRALKEPAMADALEVHLRSLKGKKA